MPASGPRGLWHELVHVMNNDGKNEVIIDVDLDGDKATDGPQEREANRLAADRCVDAGELISFCAKRNNFFSERDILHFAERQSARDSGKGHLVSGRMLSGALPAFFGGEGPLDPRSK